MMIENIDYLHLNNVKLEIKSILHENSTLAPIIFLHEGLGSVALWKNFPAKIAKSTRRDVIIYSRLGMGNSSSLTRARNINYMHEEATYYLPKLLSFLNITNPVLLGHSDGASIALIYAGNGFKVDCLILEAPHVFVESISIKGIKEAKNSWNNSNLREKLKKYHKDPDGAFNGWCNAWLSNEFRNWNIEKYLPRINSPILLIQGNEDAYGTFAQLDSIENKTNGFIKRLEIESCGHSPHTMYPNELTIAIKKFLL